MEVIKSCNTLNGGCMHQCFEDVEGIQCSCFDGYQLEADGASCTGEMMLSKS